MRFRRQQSVGAAEHCVLLVQHDAQAEARTGQHGRHRRIAAETDHDIGIERLQNSPGLQRAQPKAQDAGELVEQLFTGQARRR